MKFAVIGGDRRAALLAELLQSEGEQVRTLALERAGLPEDIPRCEHAEGALYGVDAVILPLPFERGGLLNAPYALLPPSADEVWETLWPGQLVFGGPFSEERLRRAADRGFTAVDLLRRPSFVQHNAALTAEGAVGLLLQESERGLARSRCLVLGFGRIGRLLAKKLASLGAIVTVAARREESRAEAEDLGFAAADFASLPGIFDFVVNTVPARVCGEDVLCCLPEGALLLELASAPGGFDRKLAENLGLRVMAAPGLPGHSAPYSAAQFMLREIRGVLKEEWE